MTRRRSRLVPERQTMLRRTQPGTHGLGKREITRRLVSLGLSHHDDEEVQQQALRLVERFLSWIRSQPCLVSGRRSGERWERSGQTWVVSVQAAHLKTRGSFGADLGNVVPLIDLLHSEQQNDAEFFIRWNQNAQKAAADLAMRWLGEHPDDARWLLDYANDGDVVALATAALAA